ncbi:AAA family ATPase [Endozoicomonas ascidiicola]|uniref:AAA family ATPase n=1 Tax=Endozoicomonas ascidiicola TaxID=1698521 RepID=UPI0008368FBA|nr:AAA family ATPase [Endozoicomonas ascidiicola]
MEKQSVAKTTSRKDRLNKLISELQKGLLERETQVKLTILAALAGEHVLLLGPPGTAKSELAKRLKEAFVEANYFERLLTRFSVPEELFGPLSIKSLEEDQYKRLTSGYLPQASVAFLDEIFKANSAVLNTLLTVLNERKFDNGSRREDIPLISVIAASNELPDGAELNALYDRFMLRSFVAPVSDDSFEQLIHLDGKDFDPDLDIRLKIEDLQEVQKLSEKVKLSSSVVQLMKEFRDYLAEHKIYVSDRRWRKIVKLLKVSTFTNNQHEVGLYDAWLLPHCLWEQPEQLKGLNNFYKERIAIDGDFNLEQLTSMINRWNHVLQTDNKKNSQEVSENGMPLYLDSKGRPTDIQVSKEHKKDERGRLLYLDMHGEETTDKEERYNNRQNKPVMIKTKHEPYLTPFKYSQAHINDRVSQISPLQIDIKLFNSKLEDRLTSSKQILDDHLWADEAILPEITQSLSNAIEQVVSLQKRVDKIMTGFRSLPVEDFSDIVLSAPIKEQDEEAVEGEFIY